jgi:WD40 repeat protein
MDIDDVIYAMPSVKESVKALKFSPDGAYLGVAFAKKGGGGIIFQMDESGMSQVQTVKATRELTKLCWHPTNSQFTFVGMDKTLEIWDVRGHKPSSTIALPTGENINVTWSRNGQYIALGNRSDYLTIVDVIANKTITNVKFSYEVNEMAWSYNSDHLMISHGGFSDGGGVKVLEIDPSNNCEEVYGAIAHTAATVALRIDPQYKKLVTSGADSTVVIWDLEDMVPYGNINDPDETVENLCFNGTGSQLAYSESDSKEVCIYDVNTAKRINSVSVKKFIITTLDWHPKRDLIVTGGRTPNNTRTSGLLTLINTANIGKGTGVL